MNEGQSSMNEKKPFFRNSVSVGATLLLMLVTALTVGASVFAVFYSIAANMRAEDGRYSKLVEAAAIIEDNYVGEADEEEITDQAIHGMIEALDDRWSYYVPLDDLSDYQTNANNNYSGVGVTVQNTDDKGLYVTEVSPGSGAQAAGIFPGCYITAADGISVIGMDLSDATDLIRGPENTTVVLTVVFEDGTTEDLTVDRKKIDIDPVSGELVGDTGYIILTNFNLSAADSFKEKVDGLMAQGAKSMVFDVRFNGGGRVSELCDILDYLLPECTIFVTDDKAGNRSTTESDAEYIDIPCSVLVNEDSYSAAEYFAAILQEYGYAEVIGVQTSGKGYSQSQIPLSDGSVLSLSTMTYYTPSGKSLEGVGITPDHVIDLTDEQYTELYIGALAYEDDPQLQLAIERANAAISE